MKALVFLMFSLCVFFFLPSHCFEPQAVSQWTHRALSVSSEDNQQQVRDHTVSNSRLSYSKHTKLVHRLELKSSHKRCSPVVRRCVCWQGIGPGVPGTLWQEAQDWGGKYA